MLTSFALCIFSGVEGLGHIADWMLAFWGIAIVSPTIVHQFYRLHKQDTGVYANLHPQECLLFSDIWGDSYTKWDNMKPHWLLNNSHIFMCLPFIYFFKFLFIYSVNLLNRFFLISWTLYGIWILLLSQLHNLQIFSLILPMVSV